MFDCGTITEQDDRDFMQLEFFTGWEEDVSFVWSHPWACHSLDPDGQERIVYLIWRNSLVSGRTEELESEAQRGRHWLIHSQQYQDVHRWIQRRWWPAVQELQDRVPYYFILILFYIEFKFSDFLVARYIYTACCARMLVLN